MTRGRKRIFVSIDGNDNGSGDDKHPVATLLRARDLARETDHTVPVEIVVGGGTHYLESTLVLTPEDSGTMDAPVTFLAEPGEQPVISGGRGLDCAWRSYRDGIMMCFLPEVKDGKLYFTQLFVNGKRQMRARYPDFDNSDTEAYTGYAPAKGCIPDDAPDPLPQENDDMTFSGAPSRGFEYDPENFTKNVWKRPQEAVVHVYQNSYWGNLQFGLKAIEPETHRIWFGEGGQQMGAKWCRTPASVGKRSRYFVENVFEELDSPGEWYLDKGEGILYYMPAKGLNLEDAVVEVPVLESVVEIRGTQSKPVRHIGFRGFRVTHTLSTFMERYEVPSLGDWAIHRGGSFLVEGARDCRIEECSFDAVGGNGVFVNKYNRGIEISSCKFTETGESCVCFVGSLEETNGHQKAFPYECKAENNLMHDCGVFGKQIAGIYISRAKRITAGHNHIHSMPRAGICIGDGTWGGHIIEHNHIHDTCLETCDHGPFNAWGRDRTWCVVHAAHGDHTGMVNHHAGDIFVDAMEPVVVRGNFFQEHSGWGLDLDDGASNYDIYNNLTVGCSMKLREGAHRTIHNNIWVNGANSVCFHVGNVDNHDRYFCNITVMALDKMQGEDDLEFLMGSTSGEIYTLLAPPTKGPWLEECDRNCFYSDTDAFEARVRERAPGGQGKGRKLSLEEWREHGFDRNSVWGDPMFVDPRNNDYRVKPGSPALKVGFENFEMGKWGLTEEFPGKLMD